MKYQLLTLGLATAAYAQGITEDIKPKGSPPAGCSGTFNGKFEISVRSLASPKRDLEQRASGDGALILTLKDGVILDAKDRTGYIAANYQFQFDKPAQTGAIYTAGFSACGNSSLALGGSAVFYQCLSGSFYNLYDRHWAAQCNPVLIQIVPQGGSSGGGDGGDAPPPPGTHVYTTTSVGQIVDGQPQNVPTVVTQIEDGQIQAPTDVVTQITDGQIQAPTKKPAPPPPAVTQIDDGQIQAPTGPPVSQISDGQVQVPTEKPAPPPVTQISDGQIQVPTEKPAPPPVTQISDGQIQAPTEKPAPPPVTQISDGQIQAPTETEAPPPPVTQISDGQIQAPTGPPVTQISDGQIQAPAPTSLSSVVSPPPPPAEEAPTPAPIPGDSAGSRSMPGNMVALCAAMLGFVLYL